MRNLLLLISMFGIIAGIGACSSSQVNEAKLDVSEAISDEVENKTRAFYKTCMSDVKYEALKCDDEAKRVRDKSFDKLTSFLSAEQKGTVQKSLVDSTLQMSCKFVASQAIPQLLRGIDSDYKCLQECGADAFKRHVANGLCEQI